MLNNVFTQSIWGDPPSSRLAGLRKGK